MSRSVRLSAAVRALSVMAAALAMCAAYAHLTGPAAFAFDPWERRVDKPDRDIVIVFTNDVHCGIDENIGYAGLASFRNEMMKQTPYVALVDCGDMIQGAAIGELTSGEAIIDIMNAVSYDIAVCGNHEFDYGMDRLDYLINKSTADWIDCNITYTGSRTPKLRKLKPFKIMNFGKSEEGRPVSVAFIGVATPDSFVSSKPASFMEDGKFVWSFEGDDPQLFYNNIQATIEECLIRGADFIVLLTHVGDTDAYGAFASPQIARNTWGVDAILDGHAHDVIPSMYERAKDGRLVPITSTGTKLVNIGRLVITKDGSVIAGLISGWKERDAGVKMIVDGVNAEMDKTLSKVVARSEIDLPMDENGARITRNRENVCGSFIADAFRTIGSADIGMINGGNVRASIKKGDITLRSIFDVSPFGNPLAVVKVKGQTVIDCLEWGAHLTQSAIADSSGKSLGEFGGFIHVSGLRYTINTSIPSSAGKDENGVFTGVKGARRVSGIEVMRGGEWRPIDPKAEYTIASCDYLLLGKGDGHSEFEGCEVVLRGGMPDREVLTKYLTDVLHGDLSQYAKTEGRITVK